MPQQSTPVVIETDFFFVIQRPHVDSYDQMSWVDSSGKYYGESGEVAAVAERDRMREIFGKGNVRVVRRDVKVTETPVK